MEAKAKGYDLRSLREQRSINPYLPADGELLLGLLYAKGDACWVRTIDGRRRLAAGEERERRAGEKERQEEWEMVTREGV